MNELELWQATGRRALRVARQRGWTEAGAAGRTAIGSALRGRVLLFGAGVIAGAALAAPHHHAVSTRYMGPLPPRPPLVHVRPFEPPPAPRAPQAGTAEQRAEIERLRGHARELALQAAEQSRQAQEETRRAEQLARELRFQANRSRGAGR
jgi:hypothetical protein